MEDRVASAIEHAELVVAALQTHDRFLDIEAEYHQKIKEYCEAEHLVFVRRFEVLRGEFEAERAELETEIKRLEQRVLQLTKPARRPRKKAKPKAKPKVKSKPKRPRK